MILFVAVLTVLAWGAGELIGHGVNRYLNRRYVRRWLKAERGWKRWEELHRREVPKLWANTETPPLKKTHQLVSQGILSPADARRITPGCGPGIQCWQGCDNCRPPRSRWPTTLLHRQAMGELPADFRAISGHVDEVTGERVETYTGTINPGHAIFYVFRDDICTAARIESVPISSRCGET